MLTTDATFEIWKLNLNLKFKKLNLNKYSKKLKSLRGGEGREF
jgi:hypothetical protein